MPGTHRAGAGARAQILHRLCQRLSVHHAVTLAFVHGSFVHQDSFRDIDVAIWTRSGSSDRLDLVLAEELSSATGYDVDVRVVNDAPVSFLFHALRGRPLLVRDERFLANLMERTARVYHDMAPLLRRAAREAFAA